MENQADLAVYLRVLKRRKWYFILPALAVLLLGAAITLALPSKYKAEATILVEAQEIPQEMVQTTVTGYVEERLQSINQVVLSRSNLLDLVNRFNLYPEMRKSSTTGEVVATMQESINMEPVQAEVNNPNSGRRGSATIAYELSFEGKNPEKVARVANTLASHYIEENSRQREKKADTTVKFLQQQVSQLEKELDETEEKIAKFKDKHLLALPQMTQLNMDRLHRVQENIDRKRNQVQELKDRKLYLESQLVTLEPYRNISKTSGEQGLTPRMRLKRLRSEYLSRKASLSPTHPDVISLKKQVDALEEQVKGREKLRNTMQELEEKKEKLTQLRNKFSDKHPDVVKLKKHIDTLKQEVKSLRQKQQSLQDESIEPENPTYIDIQTRIETTKMELASAKEELKELKQKQRDYQKRLEEMPQVEQKYNVLQRKYNNLKSQYKETQNRLMEAKEAQELEKNQISQKLKLVDAPATPEQPSSPNRPALFLISLVLASGVGVGSGSLAEYMDRSVYDSDELAELTQKPVLASVPYLENSRDIMKRRYRRIAVAVGIIVVLALSLWAVDAYVSPLEVIWYQLLDKFSSS